MVGPVDSRLSLGAGVSAWASDAGAASGAAFPSATGAAPAVQTVSAIATATPARTLVLVVIVIPLVSTAYVYAHYFACAVLAACRAFSIAAMVSGVTSLFVAVAFTTGAGELGSSTASNSTSKISAALGGIFARGTPLSPYARSGGTKSSHLEPAGMSFRASCQPLMTDLTGKRTGPPFLLL